MRRRILAGIFALSLSLSLALTISARAERAETMAALSDGTGKAGETVALTVELSNNPGLSGYRFTVTPDNDSITVEAIEAGTWSEAGTFLANPQLGQAMWFSAADQIGDGALFQVTLRLADGMINGQYPIQLLCVAEDTVDEKGTPVAVATQGGILTVTGGAEPPEESAPVSRPSRPAGGKPEPETPPQSGENAAFVDLPEGHWAYAYVNKLRQMGAIQGVGENRFAPENTVTRAEFVTMLYRAVGSPAASKEATFDDVVGDAWYTAAVAWAAESGVVKGTSATTFGPAELVTREQLATMLYRLLADENAQAAKTEAVFSDQDEIGAYAVDAVNTIRALGIIEGYPDGRFGPKDNATRAAAAKMLCGGVELLNQ